MADRERTVQTSEQQVREQISALEPQREELAQQSQGLLSKSKELETYAAELAQTRDTLVAMQNQLVKDQQEIATHRESLLERLGSVQRSASVPADLTSGLAPLPAAPVGPGVAKPAATPAARLFRKLRRDAKRKAIGV